MHTHIIYYATHNNKIIYIGSGLPSRFRHVTSGTSHVYGLNRLHFLEPDSVKVEILKGLTSAEEALKEEQELVLRFKPEFNNQWLIGDLRLALETKEIEIYKEDFIPVESEACIRKSKDLYQTIDSGMEPSVINAMTYYKNPKTDNEKLFKAFPLFKEWLDEGITLSDMNTLGRKRAAIDELLESNIKLKTLKSDLIADLKFKVGAVYSKSDLKLMFQDYYDRKGIKKTGKATLIKNYFKVKDASNSQGDNCFKIIKKL